MENNNLQDPQNFKSSQEDLNRVATLLSAFFSPKYALHDPETGELLARGKRQDDNAQPIESDNN